LTAGAAGTSAGTARWAARVGALMIVTLYVVAAAVAPLLPDEMYYWDWSRHPAAGYFDHPRMVALAIHAGTSIAGTNPFGVRLIPLLCGGLTLLALRGAARILGGADAGRRLVLLVLGMPLITASFLLATPDAPFLAATAVTLYAILRALPESEYRADGLTAWMAAGAFAGLALQSKYTALLVVLAVGVALLASRSLRPQLRTGGPWAAAVMALLVAAPMIRCCSSCSRSPSGAASAPPHPAVRTCWRWWRWWCSAVL